MPRRDGTGPIGRGAMTGRGLGFCNIANGVANIYRLGLGLGNGFRRNVSATPRVQKDLLLDEKKILEDQLNNIAKQLENQ